MKSIAAPSVRSPAIHLHIEKLVLDGWPGEFTARARAKLEAAVVAGLARHIREGGLAEEWRTGGAVAALRGGALRIASTAAPAALGSHIATSLADGLSGLNHSPTRADTARISTRPAR